MTAKADVAIIGGGIVGLLTARELARQGAATLVLDAGIGAGPASVAAAGILSPLPPWNYPSALEALAREGQAAWPQLAEWLQAETGADLQYRRSGMLVCDPDRAAAESWLARTGTEHAWLRGDAPAAYFAARVPETVLHLPAVAQVDPLPVVTALRSALPALGVRLQPDTPVRRLRVTGGRVTGLETAAGPVAAGRVVLAAGAWSRGLAAGAGFDLPLEPVRGEILEFTTCDEVPEPVLLADGGYVFRRPDGRVIVGSTIERTGFDVTPSGAARERLQTRAARWIPGLAMRSPGRHWAGLRPGTPDGLPWIGAAADLPGLWLNTGHFTTGITTAPAAGRLLADLLTDRNPGPLAEAFAPGRESG